METMVNVHAAKTHLSKLIEQALAGEDVIIARNGSPAVKLTPCLEHDAKAAPQKPMRQIGQFKGQIWMAPDFDESDLLIQSMFEGGDIFPKDR